MRATAMYDLLLDCANVIGREPLFRPGTGNFAHIRYCRFCNYSSGWVEQHGHDANCLHARLERALDCRADSAGESHANR